MSFKRFTLEEVCPVITDGAHTSPKAVSEGYKMLSVKDMGAFDFDYDNSKQISETDYLKLVAGKCQPQVNDVLIAKDGNSCLEYCFVFREPREVVLLSSIAILRPDTTKINPYYLMYYLGTEKAKNELREGYLSGSAIPRVVLKDFKKYPLSIPDITTQNRIVDLISVINSKIEINDSMIRNLEQLSQTFFKRWFIDFEFPNDEGLAYKSSGGKMVDSELGEIPEVFLIDVFDSLISETIGGDWGKDSLQGNYTSEVSILRGADIPEIRIGKSGKVPNRFILEKNYRNKKLLINDTIIEISGGSPTQSTGRVSYINQEILDRYNDKLLCTNFCRAMRPKMPQTGFFIYMYFNYLYNEGLFFSYENGTTGIKNLDLNSFLQVHQFPMPPFELIIKFNTVIEKYYSYIQELGNENIKLEELRGSLLPKLLSGEIEIPDESVVV